MKKHRAAFGVVEVATGVRACMILHQFLFFNGFSHDVTQGVSLHLTFLAHGIVKHPEFCELQPDLRLRIIKQFGQQKRVISIRIFAIRVKERFL